MEPQAAVLTGDLIGSTEARPDEVEAVMDLIAQIAAEQAETSPNTIRFARYRGDGWQIYAADTSDAFRIVVLILAALRAQPHLPQTRISLAIGTANPLPPQGLAAASGEVFILSGRTLDGMTKTQRFMFVSKQPDGHWQRAILSYLEWQAERWSPEQAEAVGIAFRRDNARMVETTLGISRQAAAARLKGAGYQPLAEALTAFRTTEWRPGPHA